VCSVSMTANQPSVSQVVFVCEHGNVKSLMAASYFNQLAEERGLRWRAISRGSAPDSATVPDLIAAKLRADAIDVSDFRPVKVEATEVAEATRVVTIGTDLPAGVPAEAQRIERWNDVPPASTSYDAARTSLKAHVAELLDRLSRGPADR
jgi:arsenate reductase